MSLLAADIGYHQRQFLLDADDHAIGDAGRHCTGIGHIRAGNSERFTGGAHLRLYITAGLGVVAVGGFQKPEHRITQLDDHFGEMVAVFMLNLQIAHGL